MWRLPALSLVLLVAACAPGQPPGRGPVAEQPAASVAPNRTLPVGLPARLDGEARRLVLGDD